MGKRLFYILTCVFLFSLIILLFSKHSGNILGISHIKPTPSLTPTPSPTPTICLIPTSSPKPTVTPKPSLTIKPLPTFTPTPISVSQTQLDQWFTQYANHYSVNRDMLYKIAVCESKLNPNAKSGAYAGLFQFSEITWQSTRRIMNLDTNPNLRFNAQESIQTAAFKISTGGLSAWKNCLK